LLFGLLDAKKNQVITIYVLQKIIII